MLHAPRCVCGQWKNIFDANVWRQPKNQLARIRNEGAGWGWEPGAVTIKDKPHSPVWCWNLVGIPFPANLLLRILRRIFKIDLLSLMIFWTGGLHSAKRRLLTRYLGTFSNYWTREQSPYGEVSLYRRSPVISVCIQLLHYILITTLSFWVSSWLVKLETSRTVILPLTSVTRLGDLLHFGQLFKAGGNNCFAQIAHIVRQFL